MIENIQDFENLLENELNAEQRKAVLAKSGSTLVIAGAGSGKTRVITARITQLLVNEQIDPISLVALTFTNKAAKEMQERIDSFIGPENIKPFIGTFHSYCLKLLKQNRHLLPHPDFSIFDADDQSKLLSSILKQANIQKKITPKSLAYTISSIKNNMSFGAEEHSSFDLFDPYIKEIFHAYETEKRACNALDFDDLLLEVVNLFRTKQSFKDQFNKTIKHVLVDEYQDTNLVQHFLLNQMSKDAEGKFILDSLCVVGDEDQSIYSWRGATVENMQHFEKDFPKTKVIKLEQNYRSAKPILAVANHVIKQNTGRHEKKLWSDKPGKNCIHSLACSSEYQEGQVIAEYLDLAKTKTTLNSHAILYRNHYQSRSIEEALIKKSIPYRIIGGIQFYERKEVKDILAYLRLAINQFDRVAFFRVINCPPRRLGKKFEEICYNLWQMEPFLGFKDILDKLLESDDIKSLYKPTIEQFLSFYSDIDIQKQSPAKLAHMFLKKTGYINYLKDSCEKAEALQREENIIELLKAMEYFQTQGVTSLSDFLGHVALLQKQSTHKKESDDMVQLMTLHAVKGLEFPTVIITGLEEGILPSTRSLDSTQSIEEERRLFYVGITRAKEKVLITHSKYRMTYGYTSDQVTSRFLDEIPQRLINNENFSFKTSFEGKRIFSQWLGIQSEYAQPEIVTFARPQNYAKPKTFTTKPATKSTWKVNQPVKHTSFGIGIVKKVEEKSTDKIYLTVNFKSGQKKIDSKFVKSI